METFAYICEDSLEGMLSAVFEAYEHREFPDDTVVRGLFQQRLGEKVRYVQTDIDHACRVRAGLSERAVSGRMRPFGGIFRTIDAKVGNSRFRAVCNEARSPGS